MVVVPPVSSHFTWQQLSAISLSPITSATRNLRLSAYFKLLTEFLGLGIDLGAEARLAH